MELSSFWLISIEESYASVSLLSSISGQFRVAAVGSQKNWSETENESLDIAVDESLSIAGNTANLPEEQEPVQTAFVLPPFWISSEGKIVPHKLKLIENLCKNLNLKPIGFIANDEAVVEEFNQNDGFPASFILLHISPSDFTLSLAYLGHIKERIKKRFEGEFKPQYVESSLLELKSESALPPQIIVFGQVHHDILISLKNYAWVGKKDIETFLHFPDVKYYLPEELVDIFSKIIISQMNPQAVTASIPVDEPEILLEEEPEVSEEVEEELISQPESLSRDEDFEDEKTLDLAEVPPDDLGFSVPKDYSEKLPVIDAKDFPLFSQRNEVSEPIANDVSSVPKFSFKAPKLKIPFDFPRKFHRPKISFKNNYYFLFIFALAPLLLLIPLLLSNANITLFVTPYSFDKQIPITLDTGSQAINTSTGVIPVAKKEFSVNTSTTQRTTGQKTVGDKAKGSILIFNILGKAQSLPRGSVLTDPSGKKYELADSVSVATSSFDINAGILKPGQTTALAVASDIGPEYNTTKDTKLQFKDFSENSLIAKVSDTFTGGSKKQINAVSDQDQKDLSQKVDQSITESINAKINTELSNIPGIIKETIQSKKNKVDFSREVGEEADELSATADASVVVFTLDPAIKEQIINSFLSKEPDFAQIQIDPSTFNLSFKFTKIDTNSAKGIMTITGKALPKIDIAKLKKDLVAKTKSTAGTLIKKEVLRAYNFNIKTNFSFMFMPFRSQNITIKVQTESL